MTKTLLASIGDKPLSRIISKPKHTIDMVVVVRDEMEEVYIDFYTSLY